MKRLPPTSASGGVRFDSLVEPWIQSDDPTVRRQAGATLVIILAGATTGLLSALVHWHAGDLDRAWFTGLFGLPLLGVLGVMRRTRRPDLSAHLAFSMIAAGIIVSPFLSAAPIPILLGLIALPIVAVATIGIRGGVIWTLLCTAFLAIAAVGSPLSTAEETLAWNSAIVCGCLGVSGVWLETARRNAEREASTAHQRADAEAVNRADAESSLRESQSLLSTLFRRTPSLLVLSELATGRILNVNEGFVRISGWTRDEAIGRTLTELDAWPSLADRNQLFELVAQSRAPEAVDLRLKTKSGDWVHLLASAELIEEGGRALVLAQAIDVSVRKKAENELAEYSRELEARVEERSSQLQASQARLQDNERLITVGTLAAGIAHQINNPVGAISAIAEFSILQSQDEVGPPARTTDMARILAEARRCGRIVRSVLQFARDEPTAKWVEDLNSTTKRAARLARAYVEGRDGRLDIALSRDRLPILMSPIAIEQVIVNLIRNAAESRASRADVEIRTAVEEDQAILSVLDNGRGMTEDERRSVFDPFYTTRLEDGGSGLGLSVAHGLVSDHAGTISIGEAPSGGTHVKIRLPLHRENGEPSSLDGNPIRLAEAELLREAMTGSRRRGDLG